MLLLWLGIGVVAHEVESILRLWWSLEPCWLRLLLLLRRITLLINETKRRLSILLRLIDLHTSKHIRLSLSLRLLLIHETKCILLRLLLTI